MSASGQDRLQSIVEGMPDGVVIAGMDGTIRFANPAAELLFGRPAKELHGADLGFPALKGDTTEIEVVRPLGVSVTAELRVAETEWDQERVRLVMLRDVTDRKRAEERAALLEKERLARVEAEASSHAKSEFLATMSHELRTPLNAVIGYAELLNLGIAGPLADEQRRNVTRILDSARHLLGLVNEVLDLSRVEAGRLSVQSGTFRMLDAVDSALAITQPLAEARGIILTDACQDAAVVYQGDAARTRQILLNLLNNAVKFTRPGGSITVSCEVSRQPDAGAQVSGSGPWVAARVVDTGVGIAASDLASIFDPFVQVEGGHTRSNEGSGLGLTISRRLARLMHGDLTVQSEVGKGSTFTLWLLEASAAQREAARWRAESPDTAARFQGFADIGALILRELPSLLEAYMARLRAEAMVPGGQTLRPSQLADHVASLVADIAVTIASIEEARGQPSRLVGDGAEIQIRIAEKHGAQRARMGWTANALHREWAVLGEEIERVIRLGAAALPEPALAEALVVLERFLEQARDASIHALTRQLSH